MVIKTGLWSKRDGEILDSIIGQMSDGIWEDSPAVERYWKNIHVRWDADARMFVVDVAPWLFENETGARKYLASKLKQIVKKELELSNPDIKWCRGCGEYLAYFHSHPTVGDVYFVYDRLLNRGTWKYDYNKATDAE